MKYNILLSILIFTSFVCKSQYFRANKGSVSQKKYCSVIPFEQKKNLMIVETKIDNHKYRFLFDTGAPTSITNRLAQELQQDTINRIIVSDCNNKKDSVFVVSLSNISLNNLEFNNIPSLIIPDSALFIDCLNIDGIIGSNLLRNSVVHFSFPDSSITIANTHNVFNIKKIKPLKLKTNRNNQSSPYFKLTLKGETETLLQVLFDTGMTDLFDLSTNNYQTLRNTNFFNQTDSTYGITSAMGLWGNANKSNYYRSIVPQLDFKNLCINNVLVETTDATGSRIGAELLQYATVTLDYKKNKIYISPINSSQVENDATAFPLSPVISDNTLKVGMIWDSIQVPDVSVGDVIISIDETDCTQMTPCELLFNNLTKDKKSITLVTQDSLKIRHTNTIRKE